MSHPLCKGKTPHIYSGIYLDAGKFVRASLAMEAIISELIKRLPADSIPALLYIDTPTSAHAIERETYEAQAEFRSVAPCLLRAGAGLESVGTILRHSSPETTAIYAKVDLPMLMKIAQPWPGEQSC